MPASPSTAKAVETASKEEDDTTELARFRQEWLAELQRRKAELSGTVTSTCTTTALSAESTQQSQPPLSGTKDPTGHISKENESSLETTSSREVVPSRRNLATHPALKEDGRMAPSFQTSKSLESALNIYRRAIAHEQRSELDQALLLYRQAFHLVCGRVFAMVFNHA
jgi:F-box protein 9